MINKKDFNNMREEYDKLDLEREDVIQKSREIIKLSKLIIYSLHRDDIKSASQHASIIKDEVKKLKKLNIMNVDSNMYIIAFQEYAEAMLFYEFIVNKKIPTAQELSIDSESYLLGFCDLTGELMRKAVNLSIKRKFDDVEKIRSFIDEIYGEFLKFNLRNSELRKKSDQIKWNLAKIEDLICSFNKNN